MAEQAVAELRARTAERVGLPEFEPAPLHIPDKPSFGFCAQNRLSLLGPIVKGGFDQSNPLYIVAKQCSRSIIVFRDQLQSARGGTGRSTLP
ncbi:hypothetical protein D3C75_906650 [compost metagenome]